MGDYQISIQQTEEFPKAQFRVTVEGAQQSQHHVHLSEDYWQQLSVQAEPPASLVRRSFEFLLEREPNTAILGEFALEDINSYFSEFEASIKKS